MADKWRPSTWGDEISLEYGKSLKGYRESDGNIQVFGSNGAVGWTTKALSDGPGVILGRKGAYRGVRYSKDPFFVIDTAYYVKPKTDLDMQWLYYSIIYHKLGEIDDGSPIPSTTRAAVYVTDVDIPPLPEQKAIAHILGSLDDKIELNRKMNATLEAMAQALFKSWFVDFDPVIDNALAAGNPIPDELAARAEVRRHVSAEALAKGEALANGTANREAAKAFPDSFQETEDMGWIPEGWEIKAMSELAEIGSAKRIFAKEYKESGVPFYRGKEITELSKGNSINTELFISEERFEELKSKSGAPKAKDILITSVGTIGNTYLVREGDRFYFKDGNLTWIKEYKRDFIAHYIKEWFLSEKAEEEIKNITIGSTQPAITITSLNKMLLIVPSSEHLRQFSELVESNIKKRDQNRIQSATLTQLRDTLLPKLISGELRITEAEQLTEKALA